MEPGLELRVRRQLSNQLAVLRAENRQLRRRRRPAAEDYPNRVAGHEGVLFRAGCVLKPLPEDQRKSVEAEFYQCLSQKGNMHAHAAEYAALRPFTPVYRCIESHGGVAYLGLCDLCAPFSRPCVADVKIGTSTCYSDEPAEHVARKLAKFPLQARFGYRFCGMQVFCADTGSYRRFGKDFGRSQTADEMERGDGFTTFFEGCRDAAAKREIAQQVLLRVETMLRWFEQNTCFHFRSSSVLIIYEGDPACPHSAVDVRLIDFAHVTTGRSSVDSCCIAGLKTIVQLLRRQCQPQPQLQSQRE